jgi:hypothetical protein
MPGNQVVVGVEHIGRGFVDVHLDEMVESGVGFERPPAGSVTVSVPCRTCGADLTVEVYGAAEAARRRRRSTWLGTGAGVAMVATVVLVVVTLDTPVVSLLFVLLFAGLAYVTLMLARDAAAPGVYGPWPPQAGPRSLFGRRSRDHRLLTIYTA